MKIESGTESWFKNVFDENYEYIRNYLFYLSGDIELAEDLVQDVFLKLWEKKSSVKNESVRAFLFTIARNDFLKSRRQNNYDLKFRSTYFDQVENKSPEYLMELKEFDQRLQKTIAGMPEKCRTVYLMSRIDELTYSEIAENLNVSVKAIEKQMSKALQIMQKELGRKV
ncbi:MAG TPA: RNA polymerase sigma-70 factor [Draconibacterium sp.]|nr:RNA polymerase sigma-70 factor [Draconibacterium sp.]